MTTTAKIQTTPITDQWQPATWEDYLAYLENPEFDNIRLFFNRGYLLLIDMSNEGINHALFNDLLTMVFYVWWARQPEVLASSFSNCVIEKPGQQGAAPDKVLYIGEQIPKWTEGESRRINLHKWRVPDLVGEVADTTLATDLKSKKDLYADLGIPEYWVVDIQNQRVLAFRLQSGGSYEQISVSVALNGLPIALLEATLKRLAKSNHNFNESLWFAQQIRKEIIENGESQLEN